MKKIFIVVALIALSFSALGGCGGGGAGGPLAPPGENTGIPSIVQLLPSTFIAQTNSSITLHTKVLDGNGIPVANTPVFFTNLSHPFGILSATVKNTDSSGIATVTLYSTTPGFATILAQVNSGVGQIRDRKSVFFSMLDVLAVSMRLDVDSVPPSSTPNEPSDFILFEPPPSPDDTVQVLATVFDAGGVPVGGGWGVSWSASHTEAKFVRTDTLTNLFGQAQAIVQVTPESIRNTDTTLNVMASAENGAASMVTLFLRPVIVSSVTVTADPSLVEPGGTSTITAVVLLNTGSPAPTGTSVRFTSTLPGTTTPCGSVTPFAQTDSNGVAEAEFKAPSTVPPGGVCEVTATAGGVSGSVNITIQLELSIAPESATVTSGAVGVNAGYTIIGGVPDFTITVSHPTLVTVNGSSTYPITTSSRSFVVAISSAITTDTTITITVVDSLGATATADFKVDIP